MIRRITCFVDEMLDDEMLIDEILPNKKQIHVMAIMCRFLC